MVFQKKINFVPGKIILMVMLSVFFVSCQSTSQTGSHTGNVSFNNVGNSSGSNDSSDSKYAKFNKTKDGVQIQLKRCERLGKQIACHFLLKNTREETRHFVFNRHRIRMIDTQGDVYKYNSAVIGKWSAARTSVAFVRGDLVSGIPIKASVSIYKVPSSRKIALLQLGVVKEGTHHDTFTVNLKNVPVD